jgi:hypothetical protein
MKQTVNRHAFERAFADADRKENFSYEALGLLFDYFEECDPDMELDVIAICCEYSEDTVKGIAEAYGLELPEDETEDEHRQAVFDYLSDHTSVVGDTADGFVYANF